MRFSELALNPPSAKAISLGRWWIWNALYFRYCLSAVEGFISVFVHTVSCTCRTASGQFSDGAGIQPVYTPFRSVLNKRRWRLEPPAGDFSMGWMPLLCFLGPAIKQI